MGTVQGPPSQPTWYFSTDDLPEKDRFALLNEMFGTMFLCTMKTLGEPRPSPHITGTGLALPGVTVTAGHSAGMVFDRTPRFTKLRDDVVLTVCLTGHCAVRQRRVNSSFIRARLMLTSEMNRER